MADSCGICLLAAVPGRSEASDRSEMVTQLLFGESYDVITEAEKWLEIRCHHDGYTCWIDRGQHTSISESEIQNLDAARTLLDPVNYLKLSDNSLLPIVAGARLPVQKGSDRFNVAGHDYQIAHQISVGPLTFDQLESFGMRLLNTPYLWGGRSAFGIDCSGFVQLLYRSIGINLPRDAAQQVDIGHSVDGLKSARTGDLAFFTNDSGKVHHVGMMLGRDHIIHSSTRVKIEKIDEDGIRHESSGALTHRLYALKRIS